MITETETTITCRYSPSLYVTHRRACLFYILNKYRQKIPDEVVDEIYTLNLWEVDNIETALAKLEKYVGKTIITLPESDDP
jgi:hypothetical protein